MVFQIFRVIKRVISKKNGLVNKKVFEEIGID